MAKKKLLVPLTTCWKMFFWGKGFSAIIKNVLKSNGFDLPEEAHQSGRERSKKERKEEKKELKLLGAERNV